MKGSEIAANLRNHRKEWTKYKYYESFGNSYCVIGLKLHEAGVPVESWAETQQDKKVEDLVVKLGLSEKQVKALSSLQQLNDESDEIDDLIRPLEDEYKNTDYPIEALAEALLKRRK